MMENLLSQQSVNLRIYRFCHTPNFTNLFFLLHFFVAFSYFTRKSYATGVNAPACHPAMSS